MVLTHEKMSFQQEKANTYEIGSLEFKKTGSPS